MSNDDVATQLQQLGFRVSLPALRAFFEHTTKSRIGPVEVCEKLVEMERRERESRNLLARTRLATLGKFATLDRFDWNHPRSIDRGLYEHLHATLDFIERGGGLDLRQRHLRHRAALRPRTRRRAALGLGPYRRQLLRLRRDRSVKEFEAELDRKST